jgi:hypothetical protein
VTDYVLLNERIELLAEYREITGRELPAYICRLSIQPLREALRQARSGVVFGEPKQPKDAENSSLLEWDNQDAKNGNAYGS